MPEAKTVELVAASASAITALATAFLAWFVGGQLAGLKKQISLQVDQDKAAQEEQKKWRTIEACEAYYRDPQLDNSLKAVWQRSKNGTDYTGLEKHDRDVLMLADYLESLAIGIEQGVYVEDIVKDHAEELVQKSVEAFFKGKSGSIREIIKWDADKVVAPPDLYPFLMRLYDRWFPKEAATTHFHDGK